MGRRYDAHRRAEVLVRRRASTIDEILDRVARGEARRESLLTDQSLTARFASCERQRQARARALLGVGVAPVSQAPEHMRTVPCAPGRRAEEVGRRQLVDVDFSPGMANRS